MLQKIVRLKEESLEVSWPVIDNRVDTLPVALEIDLSSQVLLVTRAGLPSLAYRISSALNGPNEKNGSGGTPRGRHRVRARIGERMPAGTVFIGRRPTGEIWNPLLSRRYPGRDWILTRILWLCGNEHGHNRGGEVDSMRRFIYIHGTPDSEPMGVPRSHGCIRMRNADVAQLFEWVGVGTPVLIR